ncbi:MAG: hypothetical protein JWM89_1098 [Acidimicrobiales bacterium]|nr:hypothetical protein [Acidimicrobiales bacterium]
MVHVVAKTHLDLGFTALAAEVERRYLTDFFPRAVAVAQELIDRGGSERLIWTTGSWILDRALGCEATEDGGAAGDAGDADRDTPLADAVAAGHLAWHALPLTTHTELMDADLVRSGLAISRDLDARFGRTTTAAKMTDVPGHTRALVPLLAEAGVTFLHIGVNPAWPVPDVPPVFRWRSPDGAEVTLGYQSGGYGGEVVVPGCPEVLAFLHTGDNLGPPTAQGVIEAHAALQARHPRAEVRASTLDAFARALAASGAQADLPVVTAEIGDPWIFGCASDPQKVAGYREVLRDLERGDRTGRLTSEALRSVRRELLLVAEHTWGLDQKEALPDREHWDLPGLAEIRATAAGRRFEASWAEQRAYVDCAIAIEGPERQARKRDPVRGPAPSSHLADPVPEDGIVRSARWEIGLDQETGALTYLVDRVSGRVLADAGHPLGLVSYQSFDEADYERFHAGLSPAPDDEWWARWDNTKPGIDAAGARSGRWPSRLVDARYGLHDDGSRLSLAVRLAFDDAELVGLGAPPEVWTTWSWSDDGIDVAHLDGASVPAEIEATVRWAAKPASRLPEALWCSFVPVVAEPERWTMDKLGQRVSPLDVVRRGGRSLHGVGEGVHYDGPDGPLVLRTPDAPLVAPGAPNLLDADPPVPDLAGGWHVLLHDNCWGTNFPMWNEGPAAFGFTLSTAPSRT